MEHKKTGLRARTFLWPLLISSLLSLALLACRMVGGQSMRYNFMVWNLFLAWVPLVFSTWLLKRLKKTGWGEWKNIVLTVLWLGFLPNSFYVVSDFIHLKTTNEVGLLFDAVMFMSFAWNGFILGFTSVLTIHAELLKRLRARLATELVGVIFVLCSFAIYLGRYLAWNTWDIVVHPVGLIFDVSDRIIRPASYPNTFTTMALFSLVLSVMYYVVYKLVAAIRGEKRGLN